MRGVKLLALGLLLSGAPLAAESVVRAAIDFGSGALKIQVARVDTETNRVEPLWIEYKPVLLTEDVAVNNGSISAGMEETARQILADYKAQALALSDQVQFSGIATAVFRKAHNGPQVLERLEQSLEIPFRILSQDEEGRLGFLTAQALNPEVDPKRLIAWDTGHGSFQVTAWDGENYQVYQGPMGHGTVRVWLSRDIRQGEVLKPEESGNPISLDEMVALSRHIQSHLPPVPNWLAKRLADRRTVVATFGDRESIFAVCAQSIAAHQGLEGRVPTVRVRDLAVVIADHLDAEDEQFVAEEMHRKLPTAGCLMKTVMDHLKIRQVEYRQAMGTTSGMLIAPELWQTSLITS
jgi:exopolyphosphatase/pppGpp-phosphohydrolase